MKIVILVPIYKNEITELEKISLEQLNRVLGEYEIRFVAPYNIGKVEYNIYDYEVDNFPNEFFSSIPAYSSLMLSPSFYQKYLDYEYMLIYQLDAFVFCDKLLEFCNMDYDYIGAPHPRFGIYWDYAGQVGNGGLSLRKISKCLEVVSIKESLLNGNELKKIILEAEDLFFAFCGKRKILEFKVPNVKIAKRFSISNDCYHALGEFDPKINFGCHSWYKGDYRFWKREIEKYGYNLPELHGKAVSSTRLDLLFYRLKERFLREYDNLWNQKLMRRIFFKDGYMIYGKGVVGRRLNLLMRKYDILVIGTISNGTIEMEINGITESKSIDELSKIECPIIVATVKYAEEITAILQGLGKIEGRDFYLYDTLMKSLMVKYLEKLTVGARYTNPML